MSDINNEPLMFLVGPNGSGKTYALRQALEEYEDESLLITEDGTPIVPRQKGQVSVDIENEDYFFKDESERGANKEGDIKEKINSYSLNVIIYCKGVINKLNLINKKSRGQEKLYNMMDILMSYNLNNIKDVYFDEPENFLDEEYLKVIVGLFRELIENGYYIRVATHNSRLLKLMNVNIDNIKFFNKTKQNTLTLDQLKDMFSNRSKDVEDIRLEENIANEASINYKLNLVNNPKAFNTFIEQGIKNENFYQCLFYKKIIIVEGQSEIAALSSIQSDFDSSIEIFNPNGKAFIPFYTYLFLALGKEVTVIIDDDYSHDRELQNHSVAITMSLNKMKDEGEIN